MSRLAAWMVSALALGVVLTGCGGHNEGGDRRTGGVFSAPQAAEVESIVVAGTVNDAASQSVVGAASASLSRALVDSPTMTVKVTGEDADKVFDGNGNSLYDTVKQSAMIPVDGGIFTFYVRPASNADFPLNLRVVARADGYTVSSANLVITADQVDTGADAVNFFPLEIKLIKTALTATEEQQMRDEVGVDVQTRALTAAEVQTNVSAGGKKVAETVQEIKIVSDPVVTSIDAEVAEDLDGDGQVTEADTQTGTGKVEVTIPASTQMIAKDESGQEVDIDASSLSMTTTYHNPITSSSLDTFPGGLEAQIPIDDADALDQQLGEAPGGAQPDEGSTTETTVSFISGGFTSVEIADANGNRVKEFSQPITLTMTVPKGTINPDTALKINAGDKVPLWNYDTDTGEWSVHKDDAGNILIGVVGDADGDKIVDNPAAADGEGNWIIGFQTTHLSWFNIDWKSGQRCTVEFELHDSDTGAMFADSNLRFKFERKGGGWSRSYNWTDTPWSRWSDNQRQALPTGVVRITNAPGDFPIRISALDRLTGESLGFVEYDDLCTDTLTSSYFDTLVSQMGAPLLVTPMNRQYADVNVSVVEACAEDLTQRTAVPSASIVLTNAGGTSVAGSTDASGQLTIGDQIVGQTIELSNNNRGKSATQTENLTVSDGGNAVEFVFPVECEADVTGATGGNSTGTL